MNFATIIITSFVIGIVSLPMIMLIRNWKKSRLPIKLAIIIPFLFVLYLSQGFVIYSIQPLYRPVYEEVDLSNIKTNVTYEFSSLFILTDYLAGFEIVSDSNLPGFRGCGGYKSGPWPRNNSDVEVIVENHKVDKEVTITLDNKTYYGFSCQMDNGIQYFDFGKLIKLESFKEYHFKFYFKTIPPPNILNLSI